MLGGLNSQDQSRSRRLICQNHFFINLSRFSWVSRQDLFLSWSRFLKSRLFQLRLGRVEIVLTNGDLSRFIKISWHYQDFLRNFRLKNLDKLRTLNQDREKIETFGKSWSPLRLLGLEGSIKTRSRLLDRQDKIKTYFLQVWDQDSQSRHDRDSQVPTLQISTPSRTKIHQ